MEIKLSFDNQTYDSEAALVEPDTKATSDYRSASKRGKVLLSKLKGLDPQMVWF